MVYPNFLKGRKKPKELLKMFVKANISVGFLSLKKNRNKCQRSITKEPKTKQNKQAKQKQKQKNSFPPILRTNSEQEICIQKIKQSHLRN